MFSLLACVFAVLIYFIFRPYFGIETLSWLCIVAAAPFAAIGYIKYNGMPAEKFFIAYIISEFLCKNELSFGPKNFFYELLKDRLEGDEKKWEQLKIYSTKKCTRYYSNTNNL